MNRSGSVGTGRSPAWWRSLAFELGLYLFLAAQFFPVRAAGGIALGLLAALWLHAWLFDPADRLQARREPVGWAILLFLAVMVSASRLAPDPDASWSTFYSHDGPGKALLAALFLSAWRPERAASGRLLAAALLLLAITNLRQFGYWHPQPIFLHPEAFDADAFYRYRNSGAMQLVLVPFLLAAWRRAAERRTRWLLPAWLAINAVILATTGFRGAWLGMAVGGAFMLGWRKSLLAAPVAIALVALAALGLRFYAPDRDNLIAAAVSRGFSDNQRIEQVWKPSLELIAEAPLTGHGFAPLAYTQAYAAKREARGWGPSVMPGAHNMVLQFAFQAGWPGAAAYILLLAAVLYGLWKQDRTWGEEAPLARAALAGWIAAYVVLGQTDAVNWPCFAVLMPLTMGILAHAKRRPGE